MVKTLERAIAEVQRLSAEDQEQIGRTLLSHVEKLRALRAEIDKSIRSLVACADLSLPDDHDRCRLATGRALAEFVDRERLKWQTLVREAGIKVQ